MILLLGSFLYGYQYPFISDPFSDRNNNEKKSQVIENTNAEVEFVSIG